MSELPEALRPYYDSARRMVTIPAGVVVRLEPMVIPAGAKLIPVDADAERVDE